MVTELTDSLHTCAHGGKDDRLEAHKIAVDDVRDWCVQIMLERKELRRAATTVFFICNTRQIFQKQRVIFFNVSLGQTSYLCLSRGENVGTFLNFV